jgi:hypothetical protein
MDYEVARAGLRRRLIVHGRRMVGAMLCWTALQAAALQWEDGRARAEAQRSAQIR